MNYDYLAGLVDGEGTISFMSSRRKVGRTRPYTSADRHMVASVKAINARGTRIAA